MLEPTCSTEMDYKTFCAASDKIKFNNNFVFTNIFVDANQLKDFMENRECRCFCGSDTAILLVPMHKFFYELYFISGSYTDLENSLKIFLNNGIAMSVRASIIGKNEDQNKLLVECFENASFKSIKKMMRTRSKKPKDAIIEAMRAISSEYYDDVSFAREEDAPEIFELLKEDFDIIRDNIPEYDEIVDNINKNQVVILRQDGKILSLHYFTIQNNILHGYFDLTRKEYRGAQGLFLAIAVFEQDYFKAQNMHISRSIAWREVTKAKLVRHASEMGQLKDGVYIYNMLWEPSNKENCLQ